MDEHPSYKRYLFIFGILSVVAIASLVIFVLLMLKPSPGNSYSIVETSNVNTPKSQGVPEEWIPTGNPCQSPNEYYSCLEQKVCRCVDGSEFTYAEVQ